MSVDLIRYDLLVQDALRDVVRRVLTDVARDGLPGDHHFFIGFKTTAPGVRLSSRLKERHPKDMTIVLQHQFWDLIVGDKSFEVGLSFNGIPERLHVPYDALTGFYDPSVKFGLQFEPTAEGEEEADAPAPVLAPVPTAAAPAPARARTTSVPATKPAEAKSTEGKSTEAKSADAKSADKASARPAAAANRTGEAKAGATKTSGERPSEPAKAGKDTAKDAPGPDKDDAPAAGAQVVRLDAFRKK